MAQVLGKGSCRSTSANPSTLLSCPALHDKWQGIKDMSEPLPNNKGISTCIQICEFMKNMWNAYMIVTSVICSDKKYVSVLFWYEICNCSDMKCVSSSPHSIVSVWLTGLPQMDRLILESPPPHRCASQKNEEWALHLARNFCNLFLCLRNYENNLICKLCLKVFCMFSYGYSAMIK